MSWHFLQEQEAASWEGTSLDGAPSALLNLMPTPAACCLPGSGTDCCRTSQCGTTCGPSTADPGAESCAWSAADSLAPTSAAPEAAPALKGSTPDCGEKWRGSLAKWDRSSLSWRTHQTLLFADSTECLETLPTWGLMRDGELWELETPAFPTAASEHGSWPTPKARDWRSGGTDPSKVQARIEKRRNTGVIDLPDAAVHRLWKPGFSGLLNPCFSETLMEWPTGWTDCAPLGMDRFQGWLRRLGKCLPRSNTHNVLVSRQGGAK